MKWSESHSVVSDSLWPHWLHSPWNSPGQNTGVGSRTLFQGLFPIQGSNPGLPPCRWILYQLSHKGSPRILEWIAYPFFRGSSQPRDRIGGSCIAGRLFTSWANREANSPGQNTGVSSLSLLQRIFPIQGSNWGLPHCRQILYYLSHQGSLYFVSLEINV